MRPGPCLALVSLLFVLAPCRAQDFVQDTWSSLYLATQLAQQQRSACAELDPALGPGLDAALARLHEAHGAGVQAGRAAAERRSGPDGVDPVGRSVAERYARRWQGKDAEGRRAECAALVTHLETHAGRSRRELVEPTFRKWFARQQAQRQIRCASLDGAARTLARRLLAGEDMAAQALRADAKMAERAAAWCQQVQAVAGREDIAVPGNFALIRETARAISEAAMPALARDPSRARANGRASARRFLAEPDWL
ncbi:MAG TPA: hypothetical protein VFM98_24805 [Ramlibacter sp.]|uniref:hypothetical protein n=1 Tax=Ramlibacter sp. TaxID=1917967 RepID=UPI002D7EEFE1|nr:hypothetical protein [Ramlibacter sp.]HET8748836.1 hypothetical protein [Ramlibacter sp.]